MTGDLRHLHWLVFRSLRWVVPAILILALLGYRGVVISELPPSLRRELPETVILSSEEEGVFDDQRIRVEVFTEPASANTIRARRWVRLTLRDPLRQPDIILYWATRASTYDQPPLGAQMIGLIDERRPAAYPLPTQASFLAGRLVLYSQGQKLLIAQIPLPSPL